MHQFLLKPKNLVFVRHAESARNAGKKGVFYTKEERELVGNVLNQDIELNEKGREQARARGKMLHEEFGHFDLIINSGYIRTIQTMQEILSQFPEKTLTEATVLQDIGIRERDAGYAYLMTREEVVEHFPWNDELWKQGDPFFLRPPGGESLADVAKRLDSFLIKLARLCEGKNILVVSHGRALVVMQSLLENWKHEHYKNLPPDLENAGMLHYQFSEEKGQLVRIR